VKGAYIQAPTHIITGLAITCFLDKQLGAEKHKKTVILICVFLSHGILDVLYPITYHPRNALFNDVFWQFYHVNVLCLTILLITFYRRYFIIMIISLLPDIEWLFIHPINYLFGIEIKPILHAICCPYKDILLLYGIDYALQPYAVFVEITYFIIVGIYFYTNNPLRILNKTYPQPKRYPKKRDYDKRKTENWHDVLQIYQAAQSHEQDIRQHYQSTFLVVESALLGIFLVLQKDINPSFVPVLSISGLLGCWLFGAPCKFRARNVDLWRMSIVQLVEDTNLSEVFDAGKYRWFAFGEKGLIMQDILGHWFEVIVISSVHLLWLYINFHFNTNLIYSSIAYVSFIGWLVLLCDPDFKGEIIREGLLY